MPVEIKVGPPVITISQGRTFLVSDPAGEIDPRTSQGLYTNDTRFLNQYTLRINDQPLHLIDSSELTFYSARFHLTNPLLSLEDGALQAQTLLVTVNRAVENCVHEDLDVTNYTGKHVSFVLELTIQADFADIFEVRAENITLRGTHEISWDSSQKVLLCTYTHGDFQRALIYRVCDDVPVSYRNGRICFEIEMGPNESWHTCCEMLLEQDHRLTRPPRVRCCRDSAHALSPYGEPARLPLWQDRAHWQARCMGVTASNVRFVRAYQQAIEDMQALRIYDMDAADDVWVPAAGVPWFVTLFGRDSLIASYQCMPVSPGFALGTLKRLAEYQATERDDWRDAQPGKILHELRSGELARLRLIPFTPYYGTADATILYLILLSETYRWTGDRELIRAYRSTAEQCLAWIDHYGDLDGDGFQEYQTFSQPGYENMGWKDAGDAVVYADGSQVKQPKALCELQAYVYDAKVRMAEIFQDLGEEQRARELLDQAETLKRRFNEAFWMEAEDCYAFGLDAEKRQISSISSNAGQCLWSGIADPARATRMVRRLLRDDMWSGWGIRTLSALNPAYNPLSYHLGSVWPHDNGIIIEGFKRYGLADEANQVIRGIFDAIEHFSAFRPPELFAGVQRLSTADFPVLYPPGANIPQAWATGSIFHMLRTILGLRADAPQRRLYVHPTLPDWLPDLEIRRLRVGACSLDIRFWRAENGISRWQVARAQAPTPEEMIEVLAEPLT